MIGNGQYANFGSLRNAVEVNELFRRNMSDVARANGNEQRPALYTDFAETAYLAAGDGAIQLRVSVPRAGAATLRLAGSTASASASCVMGSRGKQSGQSRIMKPLLGSS